MAGQSAHRYLKHFALVLIGVMTPFVNQMLFVGMPVFSDIGLELLVASVLLAAIGALIMNLVGVGLRTLLLVILAFYFLDGAVGLKTIVSLIATSLGLSGAELGSGAGALATDAIGVATVAAILGALFWLFWRLRAHAVDMMLSCFGVALAATAASYMISSPSAGARPAFGGASSSDAPLILHLVLDGHIAPEALPREVAGAQAASQDLRQFYEDFGFRLYGRVYSTTDVTRQAVSRMLNYDLSGSIDDNPYLDDKTIIKNQHFDELARRGYRIWVYQRKHPDLCQHPEVVYCHEYDSRGGFHFAQEARKHASSLPARLLTSVFILTNPRSVTHLVTHRILDKFTAVPISAASPYEALSTMARLFDDVANAPPGTAIVGHILLPHPPFALTEDCEIVAAADESSRRESYQAYFRQMRCVYMSLRDMMGRPGVATALDRATIVIHGDHGARIDPLANRWPRLPTSTFSTI